MFSESFKINHIFRNKLFINFPGRDLGGVFAFLKGFRYDAWLACGLFVFVLPAFLFLAHIILMQFQMYENSNWSFGWNLLVFLAALTQQGSISYLDQKFDIIFTLNLSRVKTQRQDTSAQGWFSSSCFLQVSSYLKASGK